MKKITIKVNSKSESKSLELLNDIKINENTAGAAIYLASRAGDYVVGSTVVVDGGVTYAR